MRTVLLFVSIGVVSVWHSVFALQAPYLISAIGASDTSVSLAWRNNDIASTGFIIQRKDSTATAYKITDSIKSATQLTYIDRNGLHPATLYTYQIIAYSATDMSDTSNGIQASTLPGVLVKPTISVAWNYDTSTAAKITINDFSNCELGYRIYRDKGFSNSFNLVGQIASANPRLKDTIVWFDPTVLKNEWYNYKVAAYKTGDSLFSDPCSTYTYYSVTPEQVVTFEKLGDFPISVTGGWSAKAGDSIILQENPSPQGEYTIINVSDPSHMKFDGYVDSTTLSTYPLPTLIPVFLKFGVSNSYSYTNVVNYKDRIVVLHNYGGGGQPYIIPYVTLYRYQIENDGLVFIDSLRKKSENAGNLSAVSLLLLNDTLLCVQYEVGYGAGQPAMSCFFPTYLSSTGFISFPECTLGTNGYDEGNDYFFSRFYFRSDTDNKICVTIDYSRFIERSYINSSSNLIVNDPSLNRAIEISGNNLYANAYNTGHYISSTEFLCTINGSANFWSNVLPTEIFASNFGISRPYQFAIKNNAVYRDTVHKQNQLKNILLDSLNKKIYLIFDNNLTVLSYSRALPTGTATHSSAPTPANTLRILNSSFGATIILPHGKAARSDIYIYDLSGRLVDKIDNVNSKAVFWRPKKKSPDCYIVTVNYGKEKYSARFFAR
jgi:hypothetical protein